MSQLALAPGGVPHGAAAAQPAAAPSVPLPAKRLELPPCDPGAVEQLKRALGVSRTLAQILVRRGFAEPAAARAFLAAEEAHDPAAFAGMDAAVALVQRHIARGSRITVHGDYDVDGVCATAVLVRALRELGADADWYLPGRLTDGYGLAEATVDRLAARGTRLLITVDCAITAVEPVARARAAGLDVLVTDHHQPRADGALPDAPYIHPALSGYPCAELCAAAVAYKLAGALGADADTDLDLVALATVADLVRLRGENRRLVRAGLRALAVTSKPGLRALMEVSKVDPGRLDAGCLGFRLAPRINAAGRVHSPDAALELLLTGDEERARRIAAELDSANHERRATELAILGAAEAQVRELGKRPAYVLAGEGWHPGVIGIVASRIVERYHRPAILIGLAGGVGTGSGRSIPAFDLLGALHTAAPVLERYGGHRAAAGLTIAADRVNELREAVEARAAETLGPEDLCPRERVDAVVGGAELGLALAEELQQLEPCGMGNPGVNLLVPGAVLADPRPLGQEGKHLRLTVEASGVRARAVSFGCDGRLPVPAGEAADVTFRLERNEWNGAVEPRLLLRHAAPCGEWLAHAALGGVLDRPALAGPHRAGASAPASGAPITVLGEEDYLAGVRAERDADPAGPGASGESAEAFPLVLDRRGEGLLCVLTDALATGEPVLAVAADARRRLAGLAARAGGFALTSYAALERAPGLLTGFVHLVALDPPSSPSRNALLHERPRNVGPTPAYTHLAWGADGVRFAEHIHELELGLRPPLVALYRALRAHGRVAGEELERLLRGEGPHGRPAHVAGRLIRVLEELALARLVPDADVLELTGTEKTELERSPAYRAYARRHQEGQRFLAASIPRT